MTGPADPTGGYSLPLIAVVGATGTGKSAAGLDIADALATRGAASEIVNADAMQLYRGMEIGTAKLPISERRGVAHHLLEHLAVTDEASVSAYQASARTVVEDIRARGAIPILVGGSGLYVSSVVYDFQFPGTDPRIRERLEAELEETGQAALYRRLEVADAPAAAAIGPHNARRIIRALEVIELTGEPFGSGLPDESRYWTPTVLVGLQCDRTTLVERLDARVETMWKSGLVAEVEALIPQGLEHGVTAGRAIGYAQAVAQVRGRMTQAEAIGQTQLFTRRYARRQVSWFRRYRGITWADSASGVDVAAVLARGELASIAG